MTSLHLNTIWILKVRNNPVGKLKKVFTLDTLREELLYINQKENIQTH